MTQIKLHHDCYHKHSFFIILGLGRMGTKFFHPDAMQGK